MKEVEETRGAAKTFSLGVYIHGLPDEFLSNQIQIYQFDKKFVNQNMNI